MSARKTDIILKQCPFCNGDAVLSHEHLTLNMLKASYVECTVCGVRTPLVEISPEYASDEVAAEDWNRRVENG